MTGFAALVQGRRFADEARAFIDAVGMTPHDACCRQGTLPHEVYTYALFLDAWDVWLFSEEAEMLGSDEATD